ncbi:sir2 family protein [Rhodococcus sp. MTM3W5.2]|nr:sir2 family protein [Rhodococcus sp. MTM3W5.2]
MSAPPLETAAAGEDHERLAGLVSGRRVVALTGAGMSTDSGIPDYRGPDSPPRTPMTFQQFMGDAAFRRHYWARNHLGWRYMDASRPNAGHRALARLERAGVVDGVLTQNVDLLHTKAGSRNVIDLHGSYAQVRCMACEARISRFTLAQRLDAANPGFAESVSAATGVEIAPDADAVIEETAHFVMVDCEHCGGSSNRTSSTSARACPNHGSRRHSRWSPSATCCWCSGPR